MEDEASEVPVIEEKKVNKRKLFLQMYPPEMI